MVMKALLNICANEYDIILVQEPWWGDIGGGKKGPTSGGMGWYPIPPVAVVPNDRVPRVVTYVKLRGDFRVKLRSDLLQDLDAQVLQVTQEPFRDTIIVNIYNRVEAGLPEGERSAGEWLTRCRLPPYLPVTISGDWNLHHPLWSTDPNHQRPSNAAESLVEWMGTNGFQMLNERGEETYVSHDGRFMSVLDLTWANHVATNEGSVRGWCVRPELACGSDHLAISWAVDYGAELVDNC